MESELPSRIDDSLPFQEEEPREDVRYFREPEPQRFYYPPPPTPQIQTQKKGDIFSELGRTHWIIFIAIVVLAFFMGKSISTPIIIKSI